MKDNKRIRSLPWALNKGKMLYVTKIDCIPHIRSFGGIDTKLDFRNLVTLKPVLFEWMENIEPNHSYESVLSITKTSY